MYIIRITIGATLLCLLGGIFYVDLATQTNIASTILIAVFTAWALLEFYLMLPKRGLKPYTAYGIIIYLLFFTAMWLEHRLSIPRGQIIGPLVFLSLTGFFFLTLVPTESRIQITVESVAVTILGLVYIGWLTGYYFFSLRNFFPKTEDGLWAALYIVLVAKGADIGGYLIGKKFGYHKIFPNISPKKSLEGTIAGVTFSIGFSLIMIHLSPFLNKFIGWKWGVAFGIVLGILSLMGDLSESVIKRRCGVKDSNQLIPEFGGVLDILDSLVFVAPVGYYFFLLSSQ